jgi:hypothetical protein
MPPPRPVAGLPALEPEAVASAWLGELLAGAPLAAAPAIASEALVAVAPGVVAAVAAALSGDARFTGPDGAGEALARAAAPLPPGGAGAVVAAGEALRRAVAGALAPALALVPDAAGPTHDRLAWVVAELVRGALAEPAVTDTRPMRVLLLEVDDAERLAAAGADAALEAAGRALRAALPAGARCVEEGVGRWRVSAAGAGGGAGAPAPPTAAALADAVARVPGPHGVRLRASAGEGASGEEAEERLLAARAAGLPALA